MSDKTDNNACPIDGGGCPTLGYQNIDVSVPVTVTPFAHTGTPKIKCVGVPSITKGTASHSCPKDECKFTISQRIRVEIPVVFGAKAVVGDTAVDCECAGAEKE